MSLSHYRDTHPLNLWLICNLSQNCSFYELFWFKEPELLRPSSRQLLRLNQTAFPS